MSRNKRPRKAYRPRMIAINTLDLALHRAAKPAREDRAEVLGLLNRSLSALRAGVGTEHDWTVAAGGVAVAIAIEQLGVVRGLADHLASIEATLQGIHDRCSRPNIWLRPTLGLAEVDALHLLFELHSYQVNQLSRAELIAAMDRAQKQTIAAGNTCTVVRSAELRERLAA
jgi:hypothetical protein